MASQNKKALNKSPQEVIRFFQLINLKICDDAQKIKNEIINNRARILKMKNATDPRDRIKGEEWFQIRTEVEKNQQAVLNIVYEYFQRLAETSLKGAIASGLKKLTKPLMDDLITIGEEDCLLDNQLAHKFVEDFMNEKGLVRDKSLVSPNLIQNFQAQSDLNQIKLSWVWPSDKCDQIEIYRGEILQNGNIQIEKMPLYKGHDKKYVDTFTKPGTSYTYRAFSIYMDVKSDTYTETGKPVWCMCEVTEAKSEFKNNQVHLSWKTPLNKTKVYIFRKQGVAPSIRYKDANIIAADSSTKIVYQGIAQLYKDTNIVEGQHYFYSIISQFGTGAFTKGVNIQMNIPGSPPSVKSLKAYRAKSKGKELVILEWDAIPGGRIVDYIVVKNEGDIPPESVEQGQIIYQAKQLKFYDRHVKAGIKYSYSLFTFAGGMYSRRGANSKPVYIISDVENLKAIPGDKTIELEWTLPPNVSRVIVRRSMEELENHKDGALIKDCGNGYAKDDGLQNEKLYHYLVCCVYTFDGGKVFVSKGKRISGVPFEQPIAVLKFIVQTKGNSVLCSWPKMEYNGKIMVWRTSRPHNLPTGSYINYTELHNKLKQINGEKIPTNHDATAIDIKPDASNAFYSVFTVSGQNMAVIGKIGSCVVLSDVSNLKIQAANKEVTLRWIWPEQFNNVLVVRKFNDWPTGPEDSKAISENVTKTKYFEDGQKFVQTLQKHGKYYYVLYTQKSIDSKLFYSLGKTQECRANLLLEKQMIIFLDLSKPKGFFNKNKLLIKWDIEDAYQSFLGFVLVANNEMIPTSLEDGIELFKWIPENDISQDSYHQLISLQPVIDKGWNSFYCKAFVCEKNQKFATLIVQANVCNTILSSGDVETNKSESKKKVQFYPPENIICPICFERFKTSQMLFRSEEGGDPKKGKFSTIDKWLKQPPHPPRDKRGRRLTQKLCPNKDILPFTAGKQDSIIIGIIGAKYSGKSHYIASLVHQLEGQVGKNFHAALLPVTETTQQRYKNEFYEPLFRNNLELPVTIGTPEPLLYDMSVKKNKKQLSVTMAFYDTAGENFNNQEEVQRMLKYLRVASGIIFLIDPLQFPIVRDSLPDSVPLPDQDQMEDSKEIISRVLKELENGKVVESTEKLQTPVAVVLTKCDVLKDHGLVDSNCLWNSNQGHIDYYNYKYHNDMNGFMGEYLMKWNLASYNAVTTRFVQHAFFGVSATGCASDKTTRQYQYIKPFRVEDPVLWLLAELGVIEHRYKW